MKLFIQLAAAIVLSQLFSAKFSTSKDRCGTSHLPVPIAMCPIQGAALMSRKLGTVANATVVCKMFCFEGVEKIWKKRYTKSKLPPVRTEPEAIVVHTGQRNEMLCAIML